MRDADVDYCDSGDEIHQQHLTSIMDNKNPSESIPQNIIPQNNSMLQNPLLFFFSGLQLQNNSSTLTNLLFNFYNYTLNFSAATNQPQEKIAINSPTRKS